LAGVIVLCTGWRTLTAMYHYPRGLVNTLARTHRRIDGLFFAVLLVHWYPLKPQLEPVARHPLLVLVIGLALISPMMVLHLEDRMFVCPSRADALAAPAVELVAVASAPGILGSEHGP